MSANSVIGDFDLNAVKLRKKLEFPDGTIQDTAYTGDGSETLAEILAVGNDALGQDIVNLGDLEMNGAIKQNTLIFANNILDSTTIAVNNGATNQTAFSIVEVSNNNQVDIIPCCQDNVFNPVVEANDIAIVGNAQGGRNFTICPDSATNCGLRMTDNSITMGSGGAGNVPTFYFQSDSADGKNYINGNSTIVGNARLTYADDGTQVVPSAPAVSAGVIPAFEFFSFHLTGDADSSSGTFVLAHNVSATSNYAVYPSVYYGYAGSGGTYNAFDTSGAIQTIVIGGITPTQFTWYLRKSTGDNVNVYLNFLVVYNIAGMDLYPKNY